MNWRSFKLNKKYIYFSTLLNTTMTFILLLISINPTSTILKFQKNLKIPVILSFHGFLRIYLTVV